MQSTHQPKVGAPESDQTAGFIVQLCHTKPRERPLTLWFEFSFRIKETNGVVLKLSIALILKGYPRLSETFIAQEIRALEKQGINILIVSLRHPTDGKLHPIHEEIQSPVLYLPEYLHQEPLRTLKGVAASLIKPGFISAAKLWFKDLGRDFTRNRLRRFGQAMVLAHELPPHIERLYAHFIHTPGSVTRYTAEINGLPWSASAHAKDIWTIPQWEIREKLEHMEWLATCTQANVEYLQSLNEKPEKIELVYHGLDFTRFTAASQLSTKNASSNQIQIISVGRAVPKKGYEYLLQALAALPVELDWKFTHIGGGDELDTLQAQARQLQLEDRIDWLGSQPQLQVLALYRNSDLFVLPCQVIGDGDRDGLPNVLMEAQSQRLCCLSTNISGIPELIINGETGVLVPQRDISALTAALQNLIQNPEYRQQLAEAGFKRVTENFSVDSGIQQLLKRFEFTASTNNA